MTTEASNDRLQTNGERKHTVHSLKLQGQKPSHGKQPDGILNGSVIARPMNSITLCAHISCI